MSRFLCNEGGYVVLHAPWPSLRDPIPNIRLAAKVAGPVKPRTNPMGGFLDSLVDLNLLVVFTNNSDILFHPINWRS